MAAYNRIYTSAAASGNAEKISVTILNSDKSSKTYVVQAQHLIGKTELEINTAMDAWLAGNDYSDLIGTIGVHINRNGSLCIWTGSMPDVFPEDEPQE